ncbi:MAG: protein-L-isoaspartate(D-aspartate) O-methyltransferase, partial [Pseudonocardia sp.]|nr:protein-L-isoaspartate(D-aspartate) O-methyltransferase [Pseudonocardia sp.]
MLGVPREWFIPDVIYGHGETDQFGNDLYPVSKLDQPERWWDLVRADDAVITQVDDGHPSPAGTGYELTSSASTPTLVAEMLVVLDPRPGERVLEIGTGTGWNAALLASALGAGNVTSVEVDPTVATHARSALDRAGFSAVTVITGEGLDGWPAG